MPSEYGRLSWHVLSAAGFFSNVTLWSEASYFDGSADSKPLLHLWSLAVEEQFYLFWPILLLLAWRWGRRVAFGTAALLVVSFSTNIALTSVDPAAAFYLPFGRFWELLCGALLAGLPMFPPSRRRSGRLNQRDWLSLSGPSILGLAVLLLDRSSAFPGWWAVLPVAGTSLLIASGSDALVNRTVLARKALVGAGLVSYPLYLWHWPLLSFAYIAGLDEDGVAVRLGLILLSLILAWGTFRWVEAPIRTRTVRLRPIGIVAGLAAVCVVAATTLGGAPSRIPEAVRKVADHSYDYTRGAASRRAG